MMKPRTSLLLVALTVLIPTGCSGPADAPALDAAVLDAAALDAVALDAPVDAAVDAIGHDADPSQPRPILRYEFEASGANSGTLGPAFPGSASAARWAPGKHGQAIQFTGTPSSVFAIPGTAGVFSARPRLTIGLWVREDALPSGPLVNYLIDNRCCAMATDRGFQTYHGSSGAPLTTCSVGGCRTIAYALGAWHHLLYRYDASAGARIEIFLDGAPVGAIANLSGVPIFGPGVGDLRVGFNTLATIDELVVYDQVLTDPQQCALVIGGTWSGGACVLP